MRRLPVREAREAAGGGGPAGGRGCEVSLAAAEARGLEGAAEEEEGAAGSTEQGADVAPDDDEDPPAPIFS